LDYNQKPLNAYLISAPHGEKIMAYHVIRGNHVFVRAVENHICVGKPGPTLDSKPIPATTLGVLDGIKCVPARERSPCDGQIHRTKDRLVIKSITGTGNHQTAYIVGIRGFEFISGRTHDSLRAAETHLNRLCKRSTLRKGTRILIYAP
jgi:hypothetical protein